MQVKTKGIVLHQVKYSDSSNIVNIYTRQFGKLSFMVRGINKKKSVCKSAFLQPLSVLEIDFAHYPKNNVQHLKEVRIVQPFFEIPFHPVKSSLAIFMAEILHKTLKHTEADENLYDFLEKSVFELDKCEQGLGNFHLCFLVKLSEHLGFSPNVERMETANFFDLQNGVFEHFQPSHTHFLQKENVESFKVLMEMNFNNLNVLSLTKNRRAELLNSLIEYYKLHLPDFQKIKSTEVLHDLWN
ncbi:DNA repair protein RecO [uncultured Paludibacter sp.]|nr:DNA repair protein RecO [uncultured Paludibacter sp.]